jgi:hypothetical protein
LLAPRQPLLIGHRGFLFQLRLIEAWREPRHPERREPIECGYGCCRDIDAHENAMVFDQHRTNGAKGVFEVAHRDLQFVGRHAVGYGAVAVGVHALGLPLQCLPISADLFDGRRYGAVWAEGLQRLVAFLELVQNIGQRLSASPLSQSRRTSITM